MVEMDDCNSVSNGQCWAIHSGRVYRTRIINRHLHVVTSLVIPSLTGLCGEMQRCVAFFVGRIDVEAGYLQELVQYGGQAGGADVRQGSLHPQRTNEYSHHPNDINITRLIISNHTNTHKSLTLPLASVAFRSPLTMPFSRMSARTSRSKSSSASRAARNNVDTGSSGIVLCRRR